MGDKWTYKLYMHGEQVDETDLRGLAFMKFESLKLLGLAELHEVYTGDDFDTVLHSTIVHRGGLYPPCPEDPKQCSYRKSISNDFHSTTRKTAFRTEVMCPSDRCGFTLKPSKLGGEFFDYGFCIA